MEKASIGMIGLAVMGENLSLNLAGKGYSVAVYNRELDWIDRFINGRAKNLPIVGCKSYEELVAALERPRKIWMMIQAGKPVDEVIDHLLPLLDDDDLIIDGGNSLFTDTSRRVAKVEAAGKLYIGTGVSGGEEGALHGPSLMPGGSPAAWPLVKEIFEAVAAKAPDGVPCCDWVGEGGAGHFVKMVHNGIEYGDMQLIGETYHVMKEMLGLSNDQMHDIFARWDQGELNSYLIEITAAILAYCDKQGHAVVDQILDAAGQKGTGKWTVIEAANLGQPLTLISEAVFARCLSALKEERVEAAKYLPGPSTNFNGDKKEMIADLEHALYAAKLVSYAQGFQLMRAASNEYKWSINYGAVARMWRGGCIIRSAFLGRIYEAFQRQPDLSNLLLDPFFTQALSDAQGAWRRVVAQTASAGIPIPAISAALAYYDGYRHKWLPANLLQAQRDYFGAHTYERIDAPRGKFFHTDWADLGGSATSSSYGV